jgi:hypothetical protein
LRAEKTAFSSRAAFEFPLQGIAVPFTSKNRWMSSIDCRGWDASARPQKLPRAEARIVACMSAIADALGAFTVQG